jgi:hypothetical protein
VNRGERRSVERRVRRALAASGCSCHLRLIPDDDGLGGFHTHERGCPLGDALDLRAAAGRPLTLKVPAPRECAR